MFGYIGRERKKYGRCLGIGGRYEFSTRLKEGRSDRVGGT